MYPARATNLPFTLPAGGPVTYRAVSIFSATFFLFLFPHHRRDEEGERNAAHLRNIILAGVQEPRPFRGRISSV